MPPAGPGRSLILKQTGEMNDYANNPARKGGVVFSYGRITETPLRRKQSRFSFTGRPKIRFSALS